MTRVVSCDPAVTPERSSQRTNALADRLEQGARALANFASALTDAEWQTRVPKDGRKVGLYIAYYSHQTQGRELVNSENVLVRTDDRVWKQVASKAGTLDWAGRPIEARFAELRARDEQLAVAQWYWIGGRYTASDTVAKVLLALQKLTGRDDDSAALVIYAPQGDARQPVDETLGRFAAEMSDAVTRALEQASKR